MVTVKRCEQNPLLLPDPKQDWESIAAFNGCPVVKEGTTHLLYRALSLTRQSSIGYASSTDGIHFSEHSQKIVPEFEWEKFGCEDPRVVCIDSTFYITYTALSTFPFGPEGIKLALAKTTDFVTFEKHPMTPFNAKAAALFPEKINGKFAVILTANTDLPPAHIAIALVEQESDLWNPEAWSRWYDDLTQYTLPLQRSPDDHIELGAPPIKTDKGWLLFYSYIRNYRSDHKIFGIEAVLLDLENPYTILGHTQNPLMLPQESYEVHGDVPNIIFPTGALLAGDTIRIYYGAADTTCAMAELSAQELLGQLLKVGTTPIHISTTKVEMERALTNPIISPLSEHTWENKLTFNPAAIYEGGKVHVLYRAMGSDDTSVVGYASSTNGIHIETRLPDPIYIPRIQEESKKKPGNSGCEDARLTRIGDRIYMMYTAYDGENTTKVALTWITVDDFLGHSWNWAPPILISDPSKNDKDVVLFPEKIRDRYYFIHRLDPHMWIDSVEDLEFHSKPFFTGTIMMSPRAGKWDDVKIGASCPPIKTEKGWLLIYHGIESSTKMYRQGAVLLDLEYPDHIIARLDEPILEPKEWYENNGLRPGTVFVCGGVIVGECLHLYYGGADQFCAVASIPMTDLINAFTLS